ncbi:cell division protein FtsQ/DivIB [uncultured Demequina sp.]|uniref:cell division protein FtsQ/DivIB n=1 Tax=uncultured Demequina sp. TaxID=693499 RepID=UPI0025ED0A53|nr:cell division protein FtsQ/DivIB [uncultured Demequina sp.]
MSKAASKPSSRSVAASTSKAAAASAGPLNRALATVSRGRWGASAASSPAKPSTPAQPRTGTVATPWAKVAATPSTVTTRMQDRLRERRSANRRLLTARWVKRLAIGGVGLAGVWVLLLSPVFALDLEKVEASGYGTVVDPAAIEEIVAEHAGTSVALLNTGHVEHQIEALAGVKEARVERVWPSGLRVTLTSAEPVAAIPLADGTYVMLDERGVQVDEGAEAPDDLPVVNVPLDAEDTRILDGVISVIDQLPVAMRDRVQDIEASTEDSIQFVLRDGPRVEWGSAEESALKAEVLAVLLQEAGDAELIDVSAPTLPTVS